MVIVHNKSLDWYIKKLIKKEYFSIGAYGDGEWTAILDKPLGQTNAEGTIYTQELCDALEKSLEFKSDNFFFSSPKGIMEKRIDKFLKKKELDIEFYEKEMWNDEMVAGNLSPFIRQLRKMNVVIISNKHLRKLDFLNYDKFIEVGYPNCYTELDRVYRECLEYGKSGVYLVAMGLPATLLVQKLHGRILNSFFLDLGSIWDAFVGIGGQRGFRQELYADKEKYKQWREANLKDI